MATSRICSFQEIMGDQQRKQFTERQVHLPKNECRDCRFWGICHGGCPLDAFMTYKDFIHRAPSCDAMRIFIEKYFEPITGLKANFMPPEHTLN